MGRLRDDSRAVEPGDAFIAVPGGTHDGHRFIAQAVEAGASVVIVERDRTEPPAGSHVWVPDTRKAYPEIAANAFGRPARALRMAGITGTNGKTTTAHLVGSILAEAGREHSRLGTTGNWLVDREDAAGLTTPFPLELQELLATTVERGGTDVVMEVSSHALEQGRVQPLRFDAVGFTSFSQDHLDFHADMEAYFEAKLRLATDHLAAQGTAVAAVDGSEEGDAFVEAARRIGATGWKASRGGDPFADIMASNIEYGSERTRAKIETPGGWFELISPLIGTFNLDNALVATGIALALGVELEAIAYALVKARGAPGRLERVDAPGVSGPLVVVDYAHTPDAVARAIEAVRPICSGKLHVVLGCGGDRDPGKRPLMGAAASKRADRFWATSDNPRTEEPAAIVDAMLSGVDASDPAEVVREVDRAQAIALAVGAAASDDLVLIAGKGHEDYQILGVEKIHFDDREHAREALRRRA